ncbi:hypothetical protein [Rhizobium paknamense]|uniref:Uncharacterized protein n=1 Tax=Rhizobium paknamense TaxID=1206817 RepID=A0ABU0I8X1_9HYPH|nr:hypothetical protein [Rhizobium paknamense]MDQ0454683.1 hypothetical protein [Rhizobium paknamense]
MRSLKLSDALGQLMDNFQCFADLPGGAIATIDGDDARQFYAVLRSMRAMALNMEIELDCHRDIEASRDRREAADAEATKALGDLLVEAGGKILRPDFRGRT